MASELELTDSDVREAMQDIEGYLDISLGDARKLYSHALQHARRRLLESTRVETLMTEDVLVVTPDASLNEIISTMAIRGVSGLPVVDDAKRVVGVVSGKDIYYRLTGDKNVSFWQVLSNCLHCNRCLLKTIDKVTADDIMNSPAVTVTCEDSLGKALELLISHKCNRLPVVDSSSRLVGIITRTDLLQAHLLAEE